MEPDDFIRIAFGSCYGPFENDDTAEIFNVIVRDEPDVFIWLGDAVYLDLGSTGHDRDSRDHANAMY